MFTFTFALYTLELKHAVASVVAGTAEQALVMVLDHFRGCSDSLLEDPEGMACAPVQGIPAGIAYIRKLSDSRQLYGRICA